MKTLRHLLIILLNEVSVCSFCQTPTIKFEHIGADAGLSQSNGTAILQDSRGFMWFGTQDGLNRYDGYTFVVYKNNPRDSASLSNSYVKDLVEDSKGNIWVATLGGGLNKFNRELDRFTQYRHDKTNRSSLSDDFVNCITEDSGGDLWVGTETGGLNRLDANTGRFTSYRYDKYNPNSISDNDVTTILEDSRHRIWVGTFHGGMNLLDKSSGRFTRFQHNDRDSGSLSCNTVLRFFEDRRHRLWIATRGGGLDQLNFPDHQFHHFKNDPHNPNSLPRDVILTLAGDDKDHIWIGTENGGLSIFHPETGNFMNYAHDDLDNTSLGNNSIYSLYKDRNNNMWIGTFSGGIDLYNRAANQFTLYKHSSSVNSPSNNNILDFLEDSRGNIWIGTDGGGVELFDPKTKKFTHFRHHPNVPASVCGNYIISIREDKDKNIWMGSCGDGTTVYNPVKKTFRQIRKDPGNEASISGNNNGAMTLDKDHELWISSWGDGLNQYQSKSGNFIHYKHDDSNPNSISGDRILYLFTDSKGYIWIGTLDKGLDLFDKKTKTFTHFVHDGSRNSLSDNGIHCIYEDREGNIWIGTKSGLNCLDRQSGHFTCYFTRDGLPDALISGILEDDKGNLWVSTNHGLSRFNPQTRTFKNFSTANGLQSNEFKAHSCLKSSSGAMYFGGVNGFNEFYPDSIKEICFDPPLLITSFQIFNKEVPVAADGATSPFLQKDISEAKGITISYKQSVISFGFASLNYTIPEKKQYVYRLVGFDKKWNTIGTAHTATYTNLDPGAYTFEVKGLNNDGSWSSAITSLQLTITPPFWMTWWCRLLMATCIVGIMISIHRIRIHLIHSQKKALEQQVQERTGQLALSIEEERKARREAELANQAKSEFMANISHELRTPMNAIIGFTDLVLTADIQKPHRDYIQHVHRSGHNLLGIINDILDYSKIEAGKLSMDNTAFGLVHLVEETVDMLAIKAFEKNLELICEIAPLVPDQILGDPARVRQILVNLIGNAIKFTDKGEILVSVKKGDSVHYEQGRKCQHMSISVKDSGIGIPQEKLHKIFESFTQADASTTRKYGGTGLGLTIAKNLAEMMGGSLEVESRPGEGSVFTLHLAPEIIHERSAGVIIQRSALQHILVVDDNFTNCRLMKDIFEYMGIDCTICTSGMEALGILVKALDENQPFDLIITDHQMPVMDGVTLVKEIKRLLKDRPQPFILMLSSLEKNMVREEAGRAGIDMFLSKPVKLDELEKILASIFEKKSLEEDSVVVGPEPFRFTENGSILIAEDEPLNMLLISEVVGKMGFKVIKASNGREAIKLLTEHDPQIIFMDINMPEMDGYSAARAIRGLSKPYSDIPIIALTADAMKEDRERCLEAGMNNFISKPFRLEEIELVLKHYVSVA